MSVPTPRQSWRPLLVLEIPFGTSSLDHPVVEARRLFAETFGTFLLVLVAAGAPVVDAFSNGAIGRQAAVTAPGLMVLAMILFMGAVSGAHLNPAVTFAFALRGDFIWRRVPGYVVAQLVGATLACLFLWAMFGKVGGLGATVPGPGVGEWKAMLMELVLTLGLVSTILGNGVEGAEHRPALGNRGRRLHRARRPLGEPDQRRLDEPRALVRPRPRALRTSATSGSTSSGRWRARCSRSASRSCCAGRRRSGRRARRARHPDVTEEPLAGGNLNVVVRVGDTVRRPSGPWTPAVHSLLRHLEERGFDGAPRALGLDEQGREVLSFVAGETPGVWTEDGLAEAAALIRRFHDLCRDFGPPADAQWQRMIGAPVGEIVCHNDLAPYNTVYRAGAPVAFVDWDLAAPGPPLWDLAYAAWRFVPFYAEIETDRPTRLRLLCDAYGLGADDRARLLATIELRIRSALDTLEVWGAAGRPGWAEMRSDGSHAAGMLRSLAIVEQHRRALEAALA